MENHDGGSKSWQHRAFRSNAIDRPGCQHYSGRRLYGSSLCCKSWKDCYGRISSRNRRCDRCLQRQEKEQTAYHEAIQAEEPEVIDVLGKGGANTYNGPGDIIVGLVASTGNIAVVEAWFNTMPAKVAKHDLSLLLLDFSVRTGQAGVLQWLLSQNPIIISRTSKLNNLPQISAVLRDPVKPQQCLPPMIGESSLLSAEYIEAVSISLVRAAKRGHTEMVKLLLGCKDIDVNRRTSGGLTALCSAVVYGNLQVVRILVSHPSIDVNLSYRGGMTALHWAVVEHTKSLVLLLDCSRIDVNKKGSPGGWQSPLYQAVRFNSLHAVKLLLAHKDIDISLLN
jgi:hypothetical protein